MKIEEKRMKNENRMKSNELKDDIFEKFMKMKINRKKYNKLK
jgi:hypothetical protein